MSLSTSSCARVTDQSVGALVRMRFSVCCYRSARPASAQWVLEAWTVQWSREPYKEYYHMPPGIAKSAASATHAQRFLLPLSGLLHSAALCCVAWGGGAMLAIDSQKKIREAEGRIEWTGQ